MDNEYKEVLDEINFELLELKSSLKKQNKYLKNMNSIMNIMFIVFIFRIILIIGIILIYINFGTSIINELM